MRPMQPSRLTDLMYNKVTQPFSLIKKLAICWLIRLVWPSEARIGRSVCTSEPLLNFSRGNSGDRTYDGASCSYSENYDGCILQADHNKLLSLISHMYLKYWTVFYIDNNFLCVIAFYFFNSKGDVLFIISQRVFFFFIEAPKVSYTKFRHNFRISLSQIYF